MRIGTRFSLLCFVLELLLGAHPAAQAGEYTKPGWGSLLQSLVRFNALSLSEQGILDEYAIVTECDLYQAFYRDDFKWNKVRQAVMESIRENVATFPMSFYYDTKLQLDRYDFATKIFRFSAKATLHQVNAFEIYSVDGTGCGNADVKLLPRRFRVVLSSPITMEGLPLAENDAQAIFKGMNKSGNTDHIVYTRFNLRFVYVEPLRKTLGTMKDSTIYNQSGKSLAEPVRMDARLDSIEFYDDEAMNHMIYAYQP